MDLLGRADDGLDEELLREARYASGFACIRCACTLHQYWQLSSGAVVLLCPPCGALLARTEGGEEAVARMRDRPVATHAAFDRRRLPFGDRIPDVRIGPGTPIHNTFVPLMFGGGAVLQVEGPETGGAPVRIGITLGTADGATPEEIVLGNHWRAGSDRWRLEHPLGRYTITSSDGSAGLVLGITSPNSLAIDWLRTHADGHVLEVDGGGVRLDGEPVSFSAASSQLIGLAL